MNLRITLLALSLGSLALPSNVLAITQSRIAQINGVIADIRNGAIKPENIYDAIQKLNLTPNDKKTPAVKELDTIAATTLNKSGFNVTPTTRISELTSAPNKATVAPTISAPPSTRPATATVTSPIPTPPPAPITAPREQKKPVEEGIPAVANYDKMVLDLFDNLSNLSIDNILNQYHEIQKLIRADYNFSPKAKNLLPDLESIKNIVSAVRSANISTTQQRFMDEYQAMMDAVQQCAGRQSCLNTYNSKLLKNPHFNKMKDTVESRNFAFSQKPAAPTKIAQLVATLPSISYKELAAGIFDINREIGSSKVFSKEDYAAFRCLKKAERIWLSYLNATNQRSYEDAQTELVPFKSNNECSLVYQNLMKNPSFKAVLEEKDSRYLQSAAPAQPSTLDTMVEKLVADLKAITYEDLTKQLAAIDDRQTGGAIASEQKLAVLQCLRQARDIWLDYNNINGQNKYVVANTKLIEFKSNVNSTCKQVYDNLMTNGNFTALLNRAEEFHPKKGISTPPQEPKKALLTLDDVKSTLDLQTYLREHFDYLNALDLPMLRKELDAMRSKAQSLQGLRVLEEDANWLLLSNKLSEPVVTGKTTNQKVNDANRAIELLAERYKNPFWMPLPELKKQLDHIKKLLFENIGIGKKVISEIGDKNKQAFFDIENFYTDAAEKERVQKKAGQKTREAHPLSPKQASLGLQQLLSEIKAKKPAEVGANEIQAWKNTMANFIANLGEPPYPEKDAQTINELSRTINALAPSGAQPTKTTGVGGSETEKIAAAKALEDKLKEIQNNTGVSLDQLRQVRKDFAELVKKARAAGVSETIINDHEFVANEVLVAYESQFINQIAIDLNKRIVTAITQIKSRSSKKINSDGTVNPATADEITLFPDFAQKYTMMFDIASNNGVLTFDKFAKAHQNSLLTTMAFYQEYLVEVRNSLTGSSRRENTPQWQKIAALDKQFNDSIKNQSYFAAERRAALKAIKLQDMEAQKAEFEAIFEYEAETKGGEALIERLMSLLESFSMQETLNVSLLNDSSIDDIERVPKILLKPFETTVNEVLAAAKKANLPDAKIAQIEESRTMMHEIFKNYLVAFIIRMRELTDLANLAENVKGLNDRAHDAIFKTLPQLGVNNLRSMLREFIELGLYQEKDLLSEAVEFNLVRNFSYILAALDSLQKTIYTQNVNPVVIITWIGYILTFGRINTGEPLFTVYKSAIDNTLTELYTAAQLFYNLFISKLPETGIKGIIAKRQLDIRTYKFKFSNNEELFILPHVAPFFDEKGNYQYGMEQTKKIGSGSDWFEMEGAIYTPAIDPLHWTLKLADFYKPINTFLQQLQKAFGLSEEETISEVIKDPKAQKEVTELENPKTKQELEKLGTPTEKEPEAPKAPVIPTPPPAPKKSTAKKKPIDLPSLPEE